MFLTYTSTNLNCTLYRDAHIQNSSRLMVICLSLDETEARKESERESSLVQTRAAAELLASKEHGWS